MMRRERERDVCVRQTWPRRDDDDGTVVVHVRHHHDLQIVIVMSVCFKVSVTVRFPVDLVGTDCNRLCCPSSINIYLFTFAPAGMCCGVCVCV